MQGIHERLSSRKKKMLILITFLFVFFLSPPTEPQNLSLQKPQLNKELFSQGEILYQKQCSVCHGLEGKGDGKAAYLLYPKPRNFVEDKFRLISTTNQIATDEDLFRVITKGMAGSSMPPWEHLSEQDRWALVYYVRFLSEIEHYKQNGEITEEVIKQGLSWEWIDRIVNKKIDPQGIIAIPTEPPVTQEVIARGKELFITSCAGCHGMQGKGDGQQQMMDSLGYPTKARDLTAGIFKGDSSSEELYLRMMAGMPGSPMPSYDGVFTQEQIWDLIHYVQSLVPPEIEERVRLKQSQIVARKISEEINTDPLSPQWAKIDPVYIALTPLWWRDERIESVEVRGLYNGDKVAIHLTWSDPQPNDNLVEVESFSDGAALQFSTEQDPPFFGMGNPDHPVHIWHWKAAWEQKGKDSDIETQYPHAATDWYPSQINYEHGTKFEASESKTKFHDPQFTTGWGAGNPLSNPEKEEAAEEGASAGMGSYTAQRPKAERVDARGIWANGQWHAVFVRALSSSEKDYLQFQPDRVTSIAFAVWDGAMEDRNGQKSVSIWNQLIFE